MATGTLERPTSRPSAGSGVKRFAKSRRGAILAFVLSLFAFWYLSIPVMGLSRIPYPHEVMEFMWNELRGETLAPTTVYSAFGTTFGRLGLGFALAVAIGVPVGLAMGMSLRVEAFLRDFVVVLLTMPYLVWALVLSMWLGFGSLAPVLTVTLTAIPFIIMNIREGVRDVPRELMDMSGAFNMSRSTQIRHVIIPSQMPFIFAAMRYGFANGWKGVVVAEIFGAADGAGWTIRFWYDAHRAQGVIGYAMFFVLVSLLLERLVFKKLSDATFRWRPAVSDRSNET